MKLGCHAVLFTERITTDTTAVLEGIHDAGGQGVEIGARFFGTKKNNQLKSALEMYGLALSGLHVGFPLLDLLEEEGIHRTKKALTDAAEFLQVMPYKNIILTGMVTIENVDKADFGDARLTEADHLRNIAQNLNVLAADMKQNFGVNLNYHNHGWEFKNDSAIYNALIDYAPELRFALDIGWAEVAGRDTFSLIPALGERLHYVHLRDFKREDAERYSTHAQLQQIYTDLGQGDFDYSKLLQLLKTVLDNDDWAIIEYEKGTVSFDRYAQAIDYIKILSAENTSTLL